MSTVLSRIRVEGYRSLRDVDLELGRLTVLIGANGSGKSNLLSVIRMAALMRTQNLRTVVGTAGGASSLLFYGRRTKEISFSIEFERDDSRAFEYAVRLGHAAGDTLIFLDETVGVRGPGQESFIRESLGAGHAESKLTKESPKARPLFELLSRTNFYHFHDTSASSPLRQNSRQSEKTYLRSDGSNLAVFLRRLSTSESPDCSSAWLRILSLVRQVAPFIKRLEPELIDIDRPDTSAVRLYWVDENDFRFDVNDLSDGTIRAIALIAALAQPPSSLPSFISIDEPELGLHPAAITLIAGLARSVEPRCQVLLATQSPALLDQFGSDHVVVADRSKGETQFKRLQDQDLAGWLEDYSLSELYDKNVLGGRP